MAQILNVEKPQYIGQMIDIYTKNKIGQYSKFLDKAPLYVTYYHINNAMSRADVGTGNVEVELGEKSPIRFNKILNFPIYNIPELKPDITYDETGYDIELECNDLVILPNTIKPKPGDYFVLSYPGIKEYLFRVNAIRYNTIQSNDYYMVDADIKYINKDIESVYHIDHQIVETYLTVFENIGTDDRCFIKSSDIEYLNSLADLFYKLREFYRNAFYIRDLNSFTYQTGRWSDTGRPIYRYDMYLENFINKSHIYYDENSEESLLLTPADVVEDGFRFNFDFTLYKAVLDRSIDFLKPYCYLLTHIITMKYSIYNVMQYYAESAIALSFNKPVKTRPGGSCSSDVCYPSTGGGKEKWYDIEPLPNCVPTWTLEDGKEYFSFEFIKAILDGEIDTDDYCELIIFNYLRNIDMKIDRKEIFMHIAKNEHCFYYLPLVIYIIGTMYKKYFVSEKEIDM